MDFIKDSLGAIGTCVKRILCAICCLACGGPIMMIIGLVIIIAPNSRKDDIKEWEDTIAVYKTATTGDFARLADGASTTNSVAVAPMSVFAMTDKTVVVSGSQEDIPPNVVSRYWQATYTISGTGTQTMAYSGLRYTTAASTISVAAVASKSDTVRTTKTCKNCATAPVCGTSGTLVAGCTTTPSTSRCAHCDKTTVTYLSEACVPMTFATTRWIASTKVTSCYGTSGSKTKYVSTTTTSVKVLAKSENDPEIQLLKIAGADASFGITASDQASIGFVLLICGLLFCCCIYGTIALVVFCIVKMCSKGDQAPVDGPSGGGSYPAQQVNVQQ